RASVTELAKLLTRLPGKFSVRVLMTLPEEAGPDWQNQELAASARAIQGVEVVDDLGSIEARRFHAHTSGQTLLFTPRGDLLFSGGLTPSRGHQGDNFGSAELERLARLDMKHLSPETPSTSKVYGCALFDDTQEEGQ